MPLHYNPSHDSAYTSSSPPNLDKLGGRWQTSLEGMCIYPLSCPDVRVQLMMVMSKNTAYAKNANRLPSLSIPIVEVCPSRSLLLYSHFGAWFISSLRWCYSFPSPSSLFSQHCLLCVSAWKGGACVSSPTFLEFDSWWYWWLVLSFFLLGGRTAWSSSVIVQGKTFAARYWYDGPFVNNALEDAAEVALIILDPDNHQALATTNYSGQLYPQ